MSRELPIPGVPEHGRALKTLVEAVFLRDHLLEQLDLADAQPDTPAGEAERAALLTVVAVGAGYTGTELVAQTQRWLRRIERRWSHTRADDVRWVLVDASSAVLPELGPDLGRRTLAAAATARASTCGWRCPSCPRTSAPSASPTAPRCRPARWCGAPGVMANPLIGRLGLPERRGRLAVDPRAGRPGSAGRLGGRGRRRRPRPGRDGAERRPLAARRPPPSTPSGRARSWAATSRRAWASAAPKPYRHKDLGLVADLGGWDAVARPLGIPLTGPIAKVVTRGYHLYALPAAANRVRVAADWLFQTVLPPESTQLSVVRPEDARLATAQGTQLWDASAPGGLRVGER